MLQNEPRSKFEILFFVVRRHRPFSKSAVLGFRGLNLTKTTLVEFKSRHVFQLDTKFLYIFRVNLCRPTYRLFWKGVKLCFKRKEKH